MYKEASERGMRARNVISGFRKTGIWPICRARILDDPEAIMEPEAVPKILPRELDLPEAA
jgi:4-hydroxybenzoate polyprenyltransferase